MAEEITMFGSAGTDEKQKTVSRKTTGLGEIYLAFFSMGAVTFGGGYAMLPILERDVVGSRKWMSQDDVLDCYALSQGLPGIIAINISAFIGYRQRKVPGAIAAALGMVSPCILIITLIAACLQNFQNNPYVKHALAGISVCVSALILVTVLGLWKNAVTDRTGLIIFAAALAGSLFTSLTPVLYVVGAAAAGILIKDRIRRRAEKRRQS